MPLGTKVGLSRSDIVLDVDPAPLPQRGTALPNFRPMSFVAKRLDGLGLIKMPTWYGSRPRPATLCSMGPGCLQKKGHGPPNAPHKIFGPCLLWPNGWMGEDDTWYGGKPGHRRRCVRWGRWSQLPLPLKERPQFSVHVYCGQTAA